MTNTETVGTDRLWDTALHVLQLIADGYQAQSDGMGQFVRVENPDYWPDNGHDPYIVLDVKALAARTQSPAEWQVEAKETVGVLSVPDAMAQLAAAIEAEKRRNAVRDEMLATVIVNLEKSELTAEFAVLLRDYVRAERAKLSALETPEAAKHSDECGCGYCT